MKKHEKTLKIDFWGVPYPYLVFLRKRPKKACFWGFFDDFRHFAEYSEKFCIFCGTPVLGPKNPKNRRFFMIFYKFFYNFINYFIIFIYSTYIFIINRNIKSR
jgi:hypothetical protein